MKPPKPDAATNTGLLRMIRGFRHDLLSALPARLYRAWMAEFKTPIVHSFVCNDPDLVALILRRKSGDFPKSNRLREGLTPLLGQSVFITNGEQWATQRRIIDPAFEGGRLRESYPAMLAATQSAVDRLGQMADGQPVDIEPETSHAAADVIFRTLFSLPIGDHVAAQVFAAFRAHQDTQPIVNLAALLPLPGWLPRLHSRRTRDTARQIRGLIETMVDHRRAQIATGTAPDDLASKIMTTPDPKTGKCFDAAEMVDQVAIFFLAGHETSASALAWALYLLARDRDWQDRVAREADALPEAPSFADLSGLVATKAAFREALRLYPPVPMMVREASCPQQFRGRPVPCGAQLIVSPWHLHRHERLWDDPDSFDPSRFDTDNGKACLRRAFIPFSAGPRVCPGAGFAMLEGSLMLAMIARRFTLRPGPVAPVPVARLTVRGRNGIGLCLLPRQADQSR